MPLLSLSCVLDRTSVGCEEGSNCVAADEDGYDSSSPHIAPSGDGAAPVIPGTDAGGSGSGGGADAGVDNPLKVTVKALTPSADKLPKPAGRCPEFAEGLATFAGSAVRLWVGSDGESKLGPLVFYWYAADSSVDEAVTALGSEAIAEIKAMGGMVAALKQSTGNGTSIGSVWHSGDLAIADEVLACALTKGVGIDTSHIHAAGFGSGALQTSFMAYARSNYLASVISYSGGLMSTWWTDSTLQDPTNVVAAMIVHGRYGVDQTVIDFALTSAVMSRDIGEKGGFALDCTHEAGHQIPSGISSSAMRFIKDHGYKIKPSPYLRALPAGFPMYCKLP
jgi:hypothetical protein